MGRADRLEGFGDREALLGFGGESTAPVDPELPLRGGGRPGFGMGDGLSHEHGHVAVDAEGIGGMHECGAGDNARSVLAVEVDDLPSGAERDLLTGGPPEWSVEPGIEPVVDRGKSRMSSQASVL